MLNCLFTFSFDYLRFPVSLASLIEAMASTGTDQCVEPAAALEASMQDVSRS